MTTLPRPRYKKDPISHFKKPSEI